ncbi:polysaccharide deacetylase family protein [Salidesulfovibrio onnuriiensis]|uniref:polysaccharide deacetylase family protein n=1 Tax=Salidesulfovibrio onnuriiensis TaxID=2583823 RepID=UPI0011CB3240|nr:polysaccharide deacetylase family protein [Salidesulfovibrio onnuriiensis]
MIEKALADIRRELDAWGETGRTAFLWWRDDDAARATPELETLLALSARYSIPCNLAVIPARAEGSLQERLAAAGQVWVLQHGYAHVNHAPRNQGLGAWELGLHRPLEQILLDLKRGREELEALFGGRFVPAVVPPWNRIDPALFPHLRPLGFCGVSAEWNRDQTFEIDGVRIVSAHADLLRWKGKQAAFAGAGRVAQSLVEHLRAKRLGRAEPREPSGVLTHHLEMDGPAWEFMDVLLRATTTHGACRWLAAEDIFAQGRDK